jgi:sugar/nucleoside kinase (ribokinase family)
VTGAGGRDLDVVVVAEINVDVIVSGLAGLPVLGAERLVERVTLTAGSSGVLTATGLAALGLRVGVCGLVGADTFGQFMLAHLDRQGIDRSGVVVDPAQRTGASVLLSTPADRAILTFPGSMARATLQHIRFDVVARARHLHLSSYYLQAALRPQVPELLGRAHALGLTTSADTGHDPAEQWQVDGLLEGLDVFLPNAVEAMALTGIPDVAGALEQLAARVPNVAIKCGAQGAVGARGDHRVKLPAFPVAVQDTTGAGDAFDAGFLAGWLQGDDLARCLQRGNACGALTAGHIGGAGGFDRGAVDALLGQ